MLHTLSEFEQELFVAIKCEVYDLVAEMVPECLTLDFKNENGWTPLVYAAWKNDLRVAGLLLRHGAALDPNEDESPQHSPLSAAAYCGHLAMVKKLIAAGANPHRIAGPWLCTAADSARMNGHPAVFDYLKNL